MRSQISEWQSNERTLVLINIKNFNKNSGGSSNERGFSGFQRIRPSLRLINLFGGLYILDRSLFFANLN